jgi:hypothetical protein
LIEKIGTAHLIVRRRTGRKLTRMFVLPWQDASTLLMRLVSQGVGRIIETIWSAFVFHIKALKI